MSMTETEDLLDVYCCTSDQEVTRIVQMLRDAEIGVMVRERGSSSFPTTVGRTGDQIIAVAEHEALRAHSLIEDARRDSVISSEGEFVDG